MNRGSRLALLAAGALVLAAAGTVLATRPPTPADRPGHQASEHEAEPAGHADGDASKARALSRAAERLDVEEELLGELASEYGVGGAVRIVAWSLDNDEGATIEQIQAMRDGDGSEGSAMGWGRIAKELGVQPGIGSIIGNGGGAVHARGHGRDGAPGQQGRGGSSGD